MSSSLENLKIAIKSNFQNNALKDADSLLAQARALAPEDPEILFLSGIGQHRLNRPDIAIDYLNQAGELLPNFYPIFFNLALAQIASRKPTDAIKSLEYCISLQPENILGHLQLSRLKEQLGKIEESLIHCKRTLQLQPDHLESLLRNAQIELMLGQLEEARQLYDETHTKYPDEIKAVAGLANVLTKQGDFASALGLLEPHLDNELTPHQIALVFADICHVYNRCDEAIGILESRLETAAQLRINQRDSLISLARLYDKQENYDKAFAYYSEANSYKQTAQDYSQFANQTDNFISTWDRAFNERLPVGNIQIGQVRPVFIIGIARSGTTLTEQILASHPDVYAAGETKHLGNIMLSLPERTGIDIPYPECMEHADNALFTALAKEYIEALAKMSDGKYQVITDKMPANLWNIGLIKRLLPSAIIIHCSRQPLDVCLSNYFTDFAEGHGHTYDLRTMGMYYRQYQKMIKHWEVELGIPMLTIPYESMAEDPETWSRKLTDYCNLPWDDSCLQPHKTKRAINTASFMQVRQQIYTSSINRWKNYEKYLSPLIAELEKDKTN